MTEKSQEELAADMINNLTSKVSHVLLKEFNQLPQELQLNVVMIKTVQLLLANVLCHVAGNKDELDGLISVQGEEVGELVQTCANMAFPEKFGLIKH